LVRDVFFIRVRDEYTPCIVKEPLCLRIPGALLRPWQEDDAPSLARHADNPRIAACMRDLFPSPYTMDDARRFIALSTGTAPGLFLAIEVQGEAAGGIGIRPLDDVYRGTAEIGYWLAEPFRGRGIVTNAVRALVPLAFERTDIVRIQAGIFSNNAASMRVLERCGFTREAVHRNAITKNGVVMDEVLYVLFRKNNAR
jgi:RimJ/RimL family protein N-acetyltransferase